MKQEYYIPIRKDRLVKEGLLLFHPPFMESTPSVNTNLENLCKKKNKVTTPATVCGAKRSL
jgi:hypothetical protein